MHSRAKLLESIIDNLLPKNSGLLSAFGYGSVVFPQHGRTTANSQLDLMLIVKDPILWHSKNIEKNPLHYSTLARSFDNILLMNLLKNWPSAVYYNPLITWLDETKHFPPHLIKYGVIGYNTLLQDLTCWTDLYIAGRLHKPVLWVSNTIDDANELNSSIHQNIKSSLAFSLLQYNFNDYGFLSEDTLYRTLASISYNGDWRLYFGEDRKKIMRLVTGESRKLAFRNLYLPIMTSSPFNEILSIDTCPDDCLKIHMNAPTSHSRRLLLMCLPENFCLHATGREKNIALARDDLINLKHESCTSRLSATAASIVRWSSYRQTLLGLFSAGFSRSVTYAFEKLRKMIKSL